MPVDPSQLEKALAAISKVYGSENVHTGERHPDIGRISTGAAELDWVTGGGIPVGRWSHFYGGFSSAKTLTSWNIVREAQKLGMVCAYYNLEKQYEKALLVRRGINVKELLIVEGSTIEGTGAKLESLLGSVHLHVIDSLASAVSIEELKSDIEDHHMGLQARTWAKVLRRVNERFDDKENTIIMINQVRDVFSRGGGETPPGGRFIEFMSSLSCYFRRSSWLYKDAKGMLDSDGSSGPSLSGDTQPDGIEFQVRVQKSRVCQPLRSARLRLDFETLEFDELWALAKAADFFKIVTNHGSGRYELDDGRKAHGKAKLRELIADDRKLQERIKGAIAAAH